MFKDLNDLEAMQLFYTIGCSWTFTKAFDVFVYSSPHTNNYTDYCLILSVKPVGTNPSKMANRLSTEILQATAMQACHHIVSYHIYNRRFEKNAILQCGSE